MTKQEQIEEMAVIGCVRNPQAHTTEECLKCEFSDGCCNAYRHAEKLYNAGYKKLPEDAIILTKEEYIDLSQNYVKEQKEQAVKEFAEKLKELLRNDYNIKPSGFTGGFIDERRVFEYIDKLLKEYEK